MKELDNFYLSREEPIRGCLLALREIILSLDKDISSAFKYGMPFFCYKGKMFCYLWTHKKYHLPYIGLVEGKKIDHPLLILEKRARMKIMLFHPDEDLPVDTIENILNKALDLYKTGQIEIKKNKNQ